MMISKGKTPFMKAEDRLMEAFASEMEALGLKAHTTGISGFYRADGVFMAQLTTEPEPLKGNKGKVEALRAAGYAVDVYQVKNGHLHQLAKIGMQGNGHVYANFPEPFSVVRP